MVRFCILFLPKGLNRKSYILKPKTSNVVMSDDGLSANSSMRVRSDFEDVVLLLVSCFSVANRALLKR